MKKSRVRDYIESAILVFIIAMILRFLVLYPYKVEDNEMSPALRAGDFIWSYRLAFGLGNPFEPEKRWSLKSPERNEVVILEVPYDGGLTFARRIVGIEGDKVEVTDHSLFVNDVRVEHQFRLPNKLNAIIIPPGYVFALADNLEFTNNAAQGEGIVPINQLRGRVWKIWFSRNWEKGSPRKGKVQWDRLFQSVN